MSTDTTPARRIDSIPKAYEPQSVEKRLYAWWEERGYFKPRERADRKPFVISMPPPNVTGALHLGHAITATIEDALIRYHRMKGDPTLWVPGEDHAGIATQAVVEKALAKEGTNRHVIGREAFVERVWDWVHQYRHRIQDQHRRLGASCDWSRVRFTLDDGLSRAVRETFVRLWEEKLLYRAERIINWCPDCMSSISDLEVETEETQGKLTHIRYPLEDPVKGGPTHITVATTRPETMLGDTAVAVHPDDKRYQKLIGKYLILPITNRRIPIVGDDAVDASFGTGAVKVTPAHDPTDFEIGNRHDLPRIQVIGFDAKMTVEAGEFAGLDRFEARKAVVAKLKVLGAIEKEEEYTVPLGYCQRSHTIIEPLISMQWWVRMAPLATGALGAVTYGQTKIVPQRFNKTYAEWMENIRDWNISRQLWWGHRIPAWYCASCGEITVAREDPAACAHCGSEKLERDPDVLDTWFSSWLWPFSTLGWPDKTPDLERYYPTAVLETGYDILFFWVARMMMAGIHFMGVAPFSTIYLHGLVRDEQGRKMSKSLGNVIDPLEVMDEYGTDALRFTLATSSSPGNDMKLVPARIVGNRNFANKIWNASRFVIGQTAEVTAEIPALEALAPKSLADKWIVSRAARLTQEVTRLLEDFQLGEAGRQIFDFIWSEYCDWYIEVAKVQLQDAAQREGTARILRSVLDTSLRLLHPFMPYVTEEVWQHLMSDVPEAMHPADALIIAPWPSLAEVHAERLLSEPDEAEFALVREIVTRIRDARNQAGVEPAKRVKAIFAAGTKAPLLKKQAALIEQLARTEAPVIERKLAAKPDQAMALVAGSVEVFLPLSGMLDLAKERTRLEGEMVAAQDAIARARKMLDNPSFMGRARPDVVQRERDNLAAAQNTLAKLEARRKELGL